jgi:hypothetical protein
MGRNIFKNMAVLKKTIKVSIVSALITGALISISACENNKPVIVGAILPHHLLVENEIDNVYKELAVKTNFERIIIISPNHFNAGIRYIQSTDRLKHNVALEINPILKLDDKKILSIEPQSFKNEHGIANHLPFITEYFPNAEIIPIIINEETALKDDNRIISWLDEWSENPTITNNTLRIIQDLSITDTSNNPEAIAIASPQSIYTLLNLLDMNGSKKFTLWKRTSTYSVTGIEDPSMNTSHIFASFT